MKKIISVITAVFFVICLCGCEKNIINGRRTTDTEIEEKDDDILNVDLPVRFAVETSDGFNPLTAESYSARRVLERVYEPLFATDGEFKPFGVLAEGASAASDGMSVTVKLKDGVLWHDNAKLTAADVVYTVKKIVAGETVLNIPKLKDASALDSLTVTIRFSEPVMNAAALLTFPVIKNNTDMNPTGFYVPVGTGKYRYAGKISVNEYSFVPFDGYHGQKAESSFEIAVVKNYEEEVQMFRAGETDAYFADINETVSAAKGSTKMMEEQTDKMVYVGINFNNPIFWGQNTRQAVERAINKTAIVNNIIFKRGKTAEYAVNPQCWLAAGLDNTPVYSLENAEVLMESDGWKMGSEGYYKRTVNGKEQECIIRILTSEDEKFLKTAEYISNELTSFGIECSVQSEPFEKYAAIINDGYYDLFIGEKSLGNNMDFSDLVKKPNVFTYVSEPLEKAVFDAARTSDDNLLMQLYHTCVLTIKNDVPFIPLYFKTSATFYSDLFG